MVSTELTSQAVDHAWGECIEALKPHPDVITGGDLIYAPESHTALLETLDGLCAAHTLVYLAHRLRGDCSVFHLCARTVHMPATYTCRESMNLRGGLDI